MLSLMGALCVTPVNHPSSALLGDLETPEAGMFFLTLLLRDSSWRLLGVPPHVRLPQSAPRPSARGELLHLAPSVL